jgi:hypothetical protein
MGYLKHVVATKGLMHSFERSAQILTRFARGKRKFQRMISFLQEDMNGDAKITFCVTASLLSQNALLFRRLKQIGHDVAAHGYIHTNMKRKSKKEQIEIIRKCSRAFDQFRMPVSGFRCPYLSYNKDTLDVLQRGGFAWTSNNMVLWHNGTLGKSARVDDRSLKKIRSLYSIQSADQYPVLPRFINNCLEIPITGPDDEMLLERFRVKKIKKIAEIWTDILEQTHKRGELFHLLFHPERFSHIKGCIKEIVEGLKRFDEPIWAASLMEITEWWKSRRTLSYEHENAGEGRWRTWVKVPERGTMIMTRNGGSNGQELFYKNYSRVTPVETRNGRQVFTSAKGRKMTIGLSHSCSKVLAIFLAEEGFLVERTTRPDDHSLFIDGHSTFSRADEVALVKEIERSSEPILRLWRWPDGTKSSFTISADVDSVTLMDFVRRAFRF